MDHIDVVSTQFLVGLWAVVACAVLLTLHSMRRPGRLNALRVLALSAAVLVSTATAAAGTVNAHYAFLPTIGDVRDAITGDRQWLQFDHLDRLSVAQQQRARHTGAIVRLGLPADPRNGFDSTAAVAYLPPQYFRDRALHFPVVYLFHGSPGRPADWFHGGEAGRFGRAAATSGHPAILVAPQMSRSWTDDPECVDGARERVESHLFDAVIPYVDSTMRTVADRSGRTFAGMSAGGYCALNLGLRHRADVSSIVDMSGYTRPTHSGGAEKLFGKQGLHCAHLIAANSPGYYAARLPPGPPMRLWLDAGDDDATVVREMVSLARTLRARGTDVRWQVRGGGHTYRVWTAALEEALPWAISGMPGRSRTNPSHPGP